MLVWQEATDLVPLAEPLDGPFVTELCDVAQRFDLHVVAGMFESGARRAMSSTPWLASAPTDSSAATARLHLYDALGWRESDRTERG